MKYLITLRVPLGWLYDPKTEIGISTTAASTSLLANVIMGATHTSITAIKRKYATLELTVAKPYLWAFLLDLKRAEGSHLLLERNTE